MLNQINYITNYNNNNKTMINAASCEQKGITKDHNNTIYSRKIEAQDYWVAEDLYGSSYEFSCYHCGGELENATSGYCKNDVRYCHNCAWDLFDQPRPISAYQIWKQEKDQEIATFKREEAERRRIREEREERERRYMREHQEEIEERQALREEQERARLQERERLKEEQEEQEEHEQMDKENYDVLIIQPQYDFECCYCGIEMTETDGYSINDDIYCCLCACELEAQEEIKSTRLTCEYTGPEEHDPKYDYDALQENVNVFHEEESWNPKHGFNDEITRCYDWDPKTGFDDEITLSREYSYPVEEDLFPNNLLPNSVEELYEYLEHVSIVPHDAIKLDEDFIYCDTYDQAKEVLTEVTCEQDDVTQLLPDDSFNISQQQGRFWYKLTPIQNNPTKFSVSVFASKDEVATKYLIRQLEECIYRIDYLLNPEDYPQEEDTDYYLKNQEPCFMCAKYNYVNVMFDAERMRIICNDCYPKVRQCTECETLTKDHTYYNFNTGARLCFDCNFKTEERVQMPLEEHLLVRRDIQHLRKPHFDVLVDYAELAEFTIFDAYHYKSKCHFYDCIQRMSPCGWDAEETLAFCCRRHREYSEDCGCHCTNVWNGTDYDDHYEEATCKICNSPHKENVKSRKAFNKSGQGLNPIVSAIYMFKEICMSNVLAESLVDLCEYFKK